MQKEAKARLKINKLLEESGWRLPDSPSATTRWTDPSFGGEGRANVVVEGYVDYQLLDEGGLIRA